MQQVNSCTCAGVSTSFRLPSADAQAGKRERRRRVAARCGWALWTMHMG